jgi:predicted methyltransferase MtxX (methanogen marker protein 4)
MNVINAEVRAAIAGAIDARHVLIEAKDELDRLITRSNWIAWAFQNMDAVEQAWCDSNVADLADLLYRAREIAQQKKIERRL